MGLFLVGCELPVKVEPIIVNDFRVKPICEDKIICYSQEYRGSGTSTLYCFRDLDLVLKYC